jgi:hypothetical protein
MPDYPDAFLGRNIADRNLNGHDRADADANTAE